MDRREARGRTVISGTVKMSRSERRLQRAVRLTPSADRARRAAEWRPDLAAARQQGLDEDDVSRAALYLAVRLRLRHTGRTLLGANGVGPAVLAWAELLAVLIAAFFIGSLVLVFALLVLSGVAMALVQASLPSRWSHRLMIASSAIGALSFAYVWWAFGVNFDAADAGTSAPRLAAWDGAGVIGVLLGVTGFITSAVVALVHEQSRHRP